MVRVEAAEMADVETVIGGDHKMIHQKRRCVFCYPHVRLRRKDN